MAVLLDEETIVRAFAILREVSAETQLDSSVIRGRSRKKKIVGARRRCAQRLHAAGMAYAEIGRFLGRHHTSIMALLGAVDKRTNYLRKLERREQMSGT